MARCSLFPLPVEALIDHPLAMTLPASAFGMLARLTLHVWQSECRPLPVADHELMHLARAHAPSWRRYKGAVLSIVEDIRPSLEAYRRQREGARRGLQNAAHSANATRRLNAISKASHAAPAFSPILFQPRKEAPRPPRPLPPEQRTQRLLVDR